MITRRDNLLVRPWQQRRYENHRKKVELALPAIDTKPPLPRQHVALKLKKQQKETERQEQIEKNNFNLLKRLSYAMRTSRVDNIWTTSQPNFLNRISLYETIDQPKFLDLMDEHKLDTEVLKGRKAKCLACTPQPVIDILIPEERIPWEPDKFTITKKRSRSVPVRKQETTYEKPKLPKSAPQKIDNRTISKSVLGRATQSITLSRGCLNLSVNFPSDTFVKLQEGLHERTLLQNICNCKNLSRT